MTDLRAASAPRVRSQLESERILSRDQLPYRRLVEQFTQASVHAHEPLFVRLAGRLAALRVVGRRWSEMVCSSFGHLQVAPRCGGAVELQIDVWDCQETGVPAPVDGPADDAPPTQLACSEDGRFIGQIHRHSQFWLDRATGRMLGFTQDARQLPLAERARPFHAIIAAWASERGLQFVHAALVVAAGRGMLLVGRGGVGKSSTAAACLAAGMGYLGDDFVCVGHERRGPYVGHGFYASCLLDARALTRLPGLAAGASKGYYADEHKSVAYLMPGFAGQLTKCHRIDAIVVPQIRDGHGSETARISRGRALLAMAPSSVMYLPSPNQRAFAGIADFVADTPCFRLDLGRDVEGIAVAMTELARSLPCAPVNTEPLVDYETSNLP